MMFNNKYNKDIVMRYLRVATETDKYNCLIHKVNVTTFFKTIEITIWLGRPVLLIGKRGENINNIIKKLEERLNYKINIKLESFDPLDIKYKR